MAFESAIYKKLFVRFTKTYYGDWGQLLALVNERSVHFLTQYCGTTHGCNASSRERIDVSCRLMKSGSNSKTSLNTKARELI